MTQRSVSYMPLADLSGRRAPGNPKKHDAAIIERSVSRFGFVEPIVIDERTGRLVAGHGRLDDIEARRDAGHEPPDGIEIDEGSWLVPVIRGWASNSDDEANAYLVVSNQATILGGWDEQALADLLGSLKSSDHVVFEASGFSDAGLEQLLSSLDASSGPEDTEPEPPRPSLADRFLVPPFSVLDARQGYWQDRKRAWLGLGFRSELGRPVNLLNMSEQVTTGYSTPNKSIPSVSGNDPAFFYKKREAEKAVGRELTTAEFLADHYAFDYVRGTSVFDPVLCEVAYRWWCPPAGQVLDPFAGGSVRGIVAAKLGCDYTGVDLRSEQVDSNVEQLTAIADDLPGAARWVVGDSLRDQPEGPYDFVFTCPPYFDLEQYSDDPADLSNADSYQEFLQSYRAIIDQAVSRLRDNRFACVVVGDIRDSKGHYRGFVGDTIAAFEQAGTRFYNEAILVTPGGSLALRAARIFNGGRKVGKAHQNVLVFVKGDWHEASEACGTIDPVDVAELFGIVLDDEPETTAVEPSEIASPSWAKGFDLARLKVVADLFDRFDGPLPLGAFSRAKETTIAEWASAGKLQAFGIDDTPVAAVVSFQAHQARGISDFRGREIARVKTGDQVVTRVACDAEHAPMLVELLRGFLPRLFVEVWQEHPISRAIVDALGLEWLGTKVKASSELIGIYGPAPADPPSGLDAWGLVEFGVSYDLAALRSEIEHAAVEWADHYAVYNKGKSWSAVALRGYGGDPEFIIKPSEMSKKWKAENEEKLAWELADTPLADRVPVACSIVDSIPGVKHRVRLMRLSGGQGELSRHADSTDPDAGIAPGQLLRLHLPIVTNEAVRFRSWLPVGDEQTTHMAAGSAWYLDTRKPHTARNDGDTDRIHLVVDVESNPELLALARDEAEIDTTMNRFELPPTVLPVEPWTL